MGLEIQKKKDGSLKSKIQIEYHSGRIRQFGTYIIV
jgi:hypothetical protein